MGARSWPKTSALYMRETWADATDAFFLYATRFVPEERAGLLDHALETLRLPSRQDSLLFLATSSPLLLVNAGLDYSRVRSDRSKLCRAVVDHEVCVYGGIEVRDIERHGAGTVRIHRICAVDTHLADVAV